MRFLVDECLPTRFAQILAGPGHDALHISDLGLLGATDEKIMATAVQEDRVLVSADTDFGELLAVGRLIGPSVILLRGPVGPPEIRAELVLRKLR